MKTWKPLECVPCDQCGGDVEVLTEAASGLEAKEGDQVRCAAREADDGPCGAKGQVTIIRGTDQETGATVQVVDVEWQDDEAEAQRQKTRALSRGRDLGNGKVLNFCVRCGKPMPVAPALGGKLDLCCDECAEGPSTSTHVEDQAMSRQSYRTGRDRRQHGQETID